MEKIQRLSPEQRDNLVAYLDGELEENAAQDIEQVLARNPVARVDVEMLTRTWELLDELPRPAATQSFTEKTLSTIKGMDSHEPITQKPWFSKARRGAIVAGWLLAIAAAGIFGFLVTNRMIPNESQTLVRELPLIEDVDIHSEIDNVEFLRQLNRSGLFNAGPGTTQPGTSNAGAPNAGASK